MKPIFTKLFFITFICGSIAGCKKEDTVKPSADEQLVIDPKQQYTDSILNAHNVDPITIKDITPLGFKQDADGWLYFFGEDVNHDFIMRIYANGKTILDKKYSEQDTLYIGYGQTIKLEKNTVDLKLFMQSGDHVLFVRYKVEDVTSYKGFIQIVSIYDKANNTIIKKQYRYPDNYTGPGYFAKALPWHDNSFIYSDRHNDISRVVCIDGQFNEIVSYQCAFPQGDYILPISMSDYISGGRKVARHSLTNENFPKAIWENEIEEIPENSRIEGLEMNVNEGILVLKYDLHNFDDSKINKTVKLDMGTGENI